MNRTSKEPEFIWNRYFLKQFKCLSYWPDTVLLTLINTLWPFNPTTQSLSQPKASVLIACPCQWYVSTGFCFFLFCCSLEYLCPSEGDKGTEPKTAEQPATLQIKKDKKNNRKIHKAARHSVVRLELFVSSQALKYFMCHFMNSSSEIK